MRWKSKIASPVTKHSPAGRSSPTPPARPPQFRGCGPGGAGAAGPGSPPGVARSTGREGHAGGTSQPSGSRARRPLTWCVLLASLATKSRTRPHSSSSPGALRRQRPPRGNAPPAAAARSPQLTPMGPDQRRSGAAGGGGASSRSWPRVTGGSNCRRRRRPRPWGQRERPSAAPRGRSIAAERRRRRHLPPGAPAHPRRRAPHPRAERGAPWIRAAGPLRPIGWPPVPLPRSTPHWLASPPASGVLDSDAKMRDWLAGTWQRLLRSTPPRPASPGPGLWSSRRSFSHLPAEPRAPGAVTPCRTSGALKLGLDYVPPVPQRHS